MVETGNWQAERLHSAARIQRRGGGGGGPGIRTAGMGRVVCAARSLASATIITRGLDCGGSCNGCHGLSLQSAGWVSSPAPRRLPRPLWRSAAGAS